MSRYFKNLFLMLSIGFAVKGTCSDLSIATWGGASSLYPYYSIYNGSNWSTPLTIGSPGNYLTTSPIYTALNSVNGQTMATWQSQSDIRPMYAIFSNGSWSTPTFISSDTAILSADVYISFDSAREIFLATWNNLATSPGIPYYSTYSHGEWSTPAAITGSAGTNNNVLSSFNPNTGNMIVTWQEFGTGHFYYAIYSESMSTGTANADVVTNGDIFSTFDRLSNNTIATWAGNSNTSGNYSAYSDHWNPTNGLISNNNIYQSVTDSYNPLLQQVIATWADGDDHHQVPMYSIYNGSSWTTQQISDDQLVSQNVFSSFNDTIQKTIAVMTDEAVLPVYSIYDGTSWSPLSYINSDPTYEVRNSIYIGPFRIINAPSHLSGIRKKNNFGTVYEYYDTLNWTLSSSSSVTAYNIYANGIKIAQVGPQTSQYQSHNKQKSATIVYAVTTIDNSGNESSTVTVTIQGL